LANPLESPEATAIRELGEETGIQLGGGSLVDLGIRPYLRDKELHLFQGSGTYEISQLKCTSEVTFPSGLHFPEMDDFRYVSGSELSKFLTAKMMAALENWTRETFG
jgi:8-oxo-dGTP pyrophosphatase MutT (NUDIX family)